MFTRLQALRFKCLRHVDAALKPFNILVGPNASGKSTLLDVFAFLRDALLSDVETAVRRRGFDLRELTWLQESPPGFEFALEATLPQATPGDGYTSAPRSQTRLRYELAVGLSEKGEIAVAEEKLWLLPNQERSDPSEESVQGRIFDPITSSIVTDRARTGWRIVIRRTSNSDSTYYHSEKTEWNFTLRSPRRKLGLAGVPEEEDRFGTALWLREALSRSVQAIQLDSVRMRQPCPADAPRAFQPDGSNLAMMVRLLQESDRERFNEWIAHLRTVLPDLRKVEVAERPENRALYLRVHYENEVVVPSWLLSDGTLRFLALTIIAYLPMTNQLFIVEEPENGIHPRALEAVYQSLSSVYDSQVFIATHSPLFLGLADSADLLVLDKTAGGTTIVRGTEHFALKDLRLKSKLGDFFAAGILGYHSGIS
ncbi:MAG: ATP-binding protein [Anaerolineae bacterium]|nr:ATP-binding protein [Anaerolineae bacterium]